MMHLSSIYFLSLFFVSFFTASTARLLVYHDRHAPTFDQKYVFHDEKVTQTHSDAIITANQIDAREKSITSRKPIINVVKRVSKAKRSTMKVCEERVKRALPRQEDEDEFVVYADYKEPKHHPPHNN